MFWRQLIDFAYLTPAAMKRLREAANGNDIDTGTRLNCRLGQCKVAVENRLGFTKQ